MSNNLNLLIRGISGVIPGGISAKDFSMIIKSDQTSAKKILDDVLKAGIGKQDDIDPNLFDFSPYDKLKYVIYVLEHGSYIDEVSRHLDWKDFEELVAEILLEKDFAIKKNLILTKPRREIDIVSIKNEIAIIIDCKHWNRTDQTSALNTVVQKQIQRTRQYLLHSNSRIVKTQSITDKITYAIPVIVTLHQEMIRFIDHVPIVPVSKFSSFIDDLYGHIDDESNDILVIRTD